MLRIVFLLAISCGTISIPPPQKGDPLPQLTGSMEAARFKHPLDGEVLELRVERPEAIPPPNTTFTTTVHLLVEIATVACAGADKNVSWQQVPWEAQLLGFDKIVVIVKNTEKDKAYTARARTSSTWPGNNFSPYLSLESPIPPRHEECHLTSL